MSNCFRECQIVLGMSKSVVKHQNALDIHRLLNCKLKKRKRNKESRNIDAERKRSRAKTRQIPRHFSANSTWNNLNKKIKHEWQNEISL